MLFFNDISYIKESDIIIIQKQYRTVLHDQSDCGIHSGSYCEVYGRKQTDGAHGIRYTVYGIRYTVYGMFFIFVTLSSCKASSALCMASYIAT